MAKSVTVLSQLLPSGSRPRAAVPGLPLPLVLQRGGCRASWLPPGWNSVAYFKLACTRSQQLQLRFFPHFICPRALRGGVEEGGAAPACSAASSSPAPAVVRLPAEMVMMLRAMSQLLTAACMERGGGGGFQIQLWASIRASILLSKSSTELRAQACQGRTVQQRGWGDPTRDQKLCAGEIPPSLTIPPPPSSFYHIFSILLRMAAIPQQPHRVCRAAAPPRRKAHGRGIHHFFSMPFPSDQAAYESCL